MLNRNNIFVSLFLIICILISSHIQAEKKKYRWIKISGKWEIRRDFKESFLIETKAKTRMWGNSELINHNSIISTKPVKDYTSIRLSIEILNPISSPVEDMIFFSAKNLKEFYAFKFSGDENRINRITFINSKIKDTRKRRTEKWNFIITELVSKNHTIKYNTVYRIEIRLQEEDVSLLINEDYIITTYAPDILNEGKIGFSNRNAMLRISDVKVLKGEEIIFKDDFSQDAIRRYKATVKRTKK